MILNIEVPEPEEGYGSAWEPGFKISTQVYTSLQEGHTMIIHANRAGLISLARYFLMLAQQNIPVGEHYHFDDYNSLEKGSVELIIDKVE
jgi:hypothetical protein